MVEMRNLSQGDEPEGESWILVEKRDSLFIITGRQNGASVDAALAPAPVDAPDAAIRAATAWADLLAVPFIYIRD